jgi:hypothetical protein
MACHDCGRSSDNSVSKERALSFTALRGAADGVLSPLGFVKIDTLWLS